MSTTSEAEFSQALKPPRACEACRSLKARCPTEGSSTPCTRCLKTGRECIYTARNRKRQRKRTDTRVSELEKEVLAISSLLKNGNGLSQSNGESLNSNLDVISRGLLTMETATALFNRYMAELAPTYPVVVFPPGCAATEVRESKPTLFLAVLAAAASTADAELYESLNREIVQVYAQRISVRGERSLELIQAILVTIVWYYAPDRFEELKFYQYIHMAGTMALDIGINKKQEEQALQSPALVHSETIESRRTLLACYVSCASVSLSLRRPNMMRFSPWMADCIEVLETSSQAAPTDKRLVVWVKFQRVMEQACISFGLDGNSDITRFEDSGVQMRLKSFEKQLESIRMTTPRDVMNECLDIHFHVNNVYLNEISLYEEHDAEHFRPPFSLRTSRTSSPAVGGISPVRIDAILSCIASSHAVFEVFLNMSIRTLRAIPIINYVRMAYCLVVLVKLFYSANPLSGTLGGLLDPCSLKVSHYLNALQVHLAGAAGSEKLRTPTKFQKIINVIITFAQLEGSEGAVEPLTHLATDIKRSKPRKKARGTARSTENASMEGQPLLQGPQVYGIGSLQQSLRALMQSSSSASPSTDGLGYSPSNIPLPQFPGNTDMASAPFLDFDNWDDTAVYNFLEEQGT